MLKTRSLLHLGALATLATLGAIIILWLNGRYSLRWMGTAMHRHIVVGDAYSEYLPSRYVRRNLIGPRGDVSDASSPSARVVATNIDHSFPACTSRTEWQPQCDWWTRRPHYRYIMFGPLRPREGIGGNLQRIAWAINRAVSYDIEIVFRQPLSASHDAGNFGTWFGLLQNPLLEIQDPLAFRRAMEAKVPTWAAADDSGSSRIGEDTHLYDPAPEDKWFQERINKTWVMFNPDVMALNKYKDWGAPVSPAPIHEGLCEYSRLALRRIFWSVPGRRDRCRSLIPFLDGPVTTRPWVIAVHVRRGDILTFQGGGMGIPQFYFVSALRAVMQAIARLTPQANVVVAVVSEGMASAGDERLQLVDEEGQPVEWDIPQSVCGPFGLHCRQEMVLNASTLETLDCLSTVDVLVGGSSQFSEAAAALSTNVKVLARTKNQEEYRVTLNWQNVVTAGGVSVGHQSLIYRAISGWYNCYLLARDMLLSGRGNGRRIYETVDMP